jgi:general secretion pathway protein B
VNDREATEKNLLTGMKGSLLNSLYVFEIWKTGCPRLCRARSVMSSILKALEKVEESQNKRRSGGVNGLARGRERRPAWILPAWVGGGAAVAALVTFAAMGGFSHPAAPVQQARSVAKPAPVVAAPLAQGPSAPVVPAVVPEQSLPVEPAQVVVVPNPKAAPKPAPAVAAKPRRVPALAVAHTPFTASAPENFAPAEAAHVPAATQVTPQVAQEKTLPEIKVTGIAWQKDSSPSAIVNGHSVQQGSMVDGFKVEQIFEDKVRFSGSNGKQDVPLGAGE